MAIEILGVCNDRHLPKNPDILLDIQRIYSKDGSSPLTADANAIAICLLLMSESVSGNSLENAPVCRFSGSKQLCPVPQEIITKKGINIKQIPKNPRENSS